MSLGGGYSKEAFTFVQDIQFLYMFGKCVVSFDLESLFTNIPLRECINQAVNNISEGNLYCSYRLVKFKKSRKKREAHAMNSLSDPSSQLC